MQRRSLSLHELENPYKQRNPSVDLEFSQQSSPTRAATFGVGQGSRLSSGSFGGEQTGVGLAPASTINASATPSWVLPRKTPPATVAGGSPTSGPGRLRGISLTDPGTVDALGRNNPNNQGA